MSRRRHVAGTVSRFGRASSMSGAEMRSLVESIGLTRRDVHRLLEVSESSVSRWWAGHASIPTGVADHVHAWVARSADLVDELTRQLHDSGKVPVYVTDDELTAVRPDLAPFGAMFHRVAAARALDAIGPEGGTGEAPSLTWGTHRS